MKILVCITGASFCEIGLRLLKILSQSEHEIYAILTKNAKKVLLLENGINFNQSDFPNITFFDNDDIGAGVASGSFGIQKTIFAPCSTNMLAKIYAGLSDDLSSRAAAVSLKEKKTLVLGVREMPFSPIALEQMSKLANLGVIIAPPVVANYSKPQNLSDLQDFIIGKWLDILSIKHDLYKRWQV